jgi:tetratricopeptide (TPR) repeat protein
MEFPKRITSGIRLLWRFAQIGLALVMLWQGARLAFRPDPRDDLRRIDTLFIAGRFHDALLAADALVAREPHLAPAFARLGMLHTIRNDQPAANRALAFAIGLGLGGEDRDLVRLYQGQVAVAAGLRDEALSFWSTIMPRSQLYSIRRVLEAESALRVEDYADAEASYRAALLPTLPPDWRTAVHSRLASLRASSDPAGALDELAAIAPPTASVPPLPSITLLVAPLLPTAQPDAAQLADALHTATPQREQLLGQLYLGAGLYTLAAAQFAVIAPNGPAAQAAATYAAYTRWSAGDRAEGRRQLEALVAAWPTDPRARALLALTYLADRDTPRAHAQLDIIRTLAPRAPDTHLAWGQWYAVQHDYLSAAEEYRRALADAPLAERGSYSLTLARFYLDTALSICEVGRPAAEEAARLLPDDAHAWSALAAARFTCGDPSGARSAAEQSLQRSPANAEARYYLGRALAQLGDRVGARMALVSTADLAPASPWRERAEAQLAALGL